MPISHYKGYDLISLKTSHNFRQKSSGLDYNEMNYWQNEIIERQTTDSWCMGLNYTVIFLKLALW